MDQSYRWFRQDELVRKCLVSNAFFSTQSGYETIIESKTSKQYEYVNVKERVDEFNSSLNMDLVLFIAQVKRSIYGKAEFEIVKDDKGFPQRFIPLQSNKLIPDIDENWELTGFTYNRVKGFYASDKVLYFTNLQLEADLLGLSDIEPVRSVCQARHDLLGENFPEIVRTLWAPYVILKADTSGLSKEEAEKTLEDLADIARTGKSIAVNETIEPTVVDIIPDITGFNDMLERLELVIVANFGTPRFLLGKPIENRATAFAELEAYIQGPINSIQRYLKREVERQLYDPWTRILLAEGKC